MTDQTTVHLMRHGEVHNPTGVLYGRMPGYHLSDLGREMAGRMEEAYDQHPLALRDPNARQQFIYALPGVPINADDFRPSTLPDNVPLDALPRLVPPCAAAVQAQRRAWRRVGAPRTARPLSVDQTGPLPIPAERRCFLRTSLKPSALPVGQGRVGGLGHSQAITRNDHYFICITHYNSRITKVDFFIISLFL